MQKHTHTKTLKKYVNIVPFLEIVIEQFYNTTRKGENKFAECPFSCLISVCPFVALLKATCPEKFAHCLVCLVDIKKRSQSVERRPQDPMDSMTRGFSESKCCADSVSVCPTPSVYTHA